MGAELPWGPEHPITPSDLARGRSRENSAPSAHFATLPATRGFVRDCSECGHDIAFAGDTWSRSAECPRCGAKFTPLDAESLPSHESAPVRRMETRLGPGAAFGPFRLVEFLGRGGMGIVYKAVDEASGRVVALKLILGDLASRDALLRFYREADSLARLQHPNIVKIHQVGCVTGIPYLALELVDGGDLPARLRRSLSPRQAARCIAAVARAVAHAHQRGVVHRDLKPSNILVASDGSLKVTDFGLVKQSPALEDYRRTIAMPSRNEFIESLSGVPYRPADSSSSDDLSAERTSPNAIVGTPAYMAPEQVGGRNDQVSPATDVFALGVMLYEMLSGRRPFAHWRELDHLDPRPPEAQSAAIPLELSEICMKCLKRDPADRFASAAELADALDRLAAAEGGVLLDCFVPHGTREGLFYRHAEQFPPGDTQTAVIQYWLLAAPGKTLPGQANPTSAGEAVRFLAVVFFVSAVAGFVSFLIPGLIIAACFGNSGASLGFASAGAVLCLPSAFFRKYVGYVVVTWFFLLVVAGITVCVRFVSTSPPAPLTAWEAFAATFIFAAAAGAMVLCLVSPRPRS